MKKFFEFVWDIICTLWELAKEYKWITAIIGLMLAGVAVNGVIEESQKKEQVIAMWEEQLPDSHWIKNDPLGLSVPFYQSMIGMGTTAFDLGTVTIGQSSDMGSIMEKVMEVEKKVWLWKYELMNADTGKKVRTIKLEPGECMSLNFYCDGVLQEFDITEREYSDKYNLWVLSCVEDTNVATINDGEITAHSKGKTILYLYCDGEIWEYNIKVK